MSDRKPALVWADIETTGLSYSKDLILEVGLRVTDWWGSEIDRFTSLVYEPFWQARLTQNEFVFNMHQESGLLAELDLLTARRSRANVLSEYGIGAVQKKALDFLAPYTGLGPHDGKFPMSGNSIRLDRSFLDADMPLLDQWFHYRNHDISALREECRVSNPLMHAKTPELKALHRPQGDIDNSIALRQFYLRNLLWVGDEMVPPE